MPAWAVITGAAAAGLIVVAGIGGFALGQASNQHRPDQVQLTAGEQPQRDGRPDGPQGQDGPDGMPGQGMDPRGGDPRGVDPDGDNWTGGGREHRDDDFGPQGQRDAQGMPGQGMDPRGADPRGADPRGVDPDGDNWTGGGRDGGQQMPGMRGPQGPGQWDPSQLLSEDDLRQLMELLMQQQGGQGFDGPMPHHGFSQGS